MPGIVGIICNNPQDKNEQDLTRMMTSMLHENNYSYGTYANDQLGVYTGWICHKDSFCDCMPVWNEKKNIALIYFGENFTDLDLFDQLKAKHHRFDNSNASYLVHMYEEKGIDFLSDLNGWFSGILIDLQANLILLFNDRYGMQKIFYHEAKDAFYFASEAKALLGICPELRQFDIQGIVEYLSCSCVLENRTLYKNIFILPCASAWIFKNNGSIRKDKYFSPDIWENQPWLEKSFFYEKLKETFTHILPRYFRAKEKIGISLTGGLDTRMFMALADLPDGKYPCYTFGSMYRDCYDVTVARQVAKACNQTHQTIPAGCDFLDNFSHWAEKTVYITDGYLDVSGASEIYVNRIARNIAEIRLTGNFGGEVMRGIKHLRALPFNQTLFNDDIVQSAGKVKDTLQMNKTGTDLSFILFNESPWCNNNRLVSEQSQLTLRTPYMDNDLVSLMYRASPDIRNSKEMCHRLIQDGKPELSKILTDRGSDISGRLIYPTLMHAYREFLFKAEYAYNYGMPQWLAKLDYHFKFMHLEKLFTGQHKFYHFRLWYRDQLSDYLKSVLLDDKALSRPYLNRKAVENVVEGHTKGYRNHTIEITQLLTLELIQRLLLEQG